MMTNKFFFSVYTDESSVVIPLKYFYFADVANVEITIDWSCDEEWGMPNSASLKIFKSDKPLTESGKPHSLYKWAGFPEFKQGTWHPMSEDGRLYHYICTIQNKWGDMGNANIFALIGGWEGDELIVEDVFVEASCH